MKKQKINILINEENSKTNNFKETHFISFSKTLCDFKIN